MRDLLLYASGTLGLAAAFVHALLGETRVFANARIEPERQRLLIRGVWHCSAVAWAGVAVLLMLRHRWARRRRAIGSSAQPLLSLASVLLPMRGYCEGGASVGPCWR